MSDSKPTVEAFTISLVTGGTLVFAWNAKEHLYEVMVRVETPAGASGQAIGHFDQEGAEDLRRWLAAPRDPTEPDGTYLRTRKKSSPPGKI